MFDIVKIQSITIHVKALSDVPQDMLKGIVSVGEVHHISVTQDKSA